MGTEIHHDHFPILFQVPLNAQILGIRFKGTDRLERLLDVPGRPKVLQGQAHELFFVITVMAYGGQVDVDKLHALRIDDDHGQRVFFE